MQAVVLAMATVLFMVGAEPALAGSPSITAAIREALHPMDRAGPTRAWIEFCEQLPQECEVDTSEPEFIPLSHDTWAILRDVNEQVNHTILAVTDKDHWGVADRWDYPDDGLGDCEDIQLLKRKLLIEIGLPRRALRMTVAIDEDGAGHAVLMVRTDHGDFILDNKRDDVLSWQETGYQYVKREGAHSLEWVWLGNRGAPVMTANR